MSVSNGCLVEQMRLILISLVMADFRDSARLMHEAGLLSKNSQLEVDSDNSAGSLNFDSSSTRIQANISPNHGTNFMSTSPFQIVPGPGRVHDAGLVTCMILNL